MTPRTNRTPLDYTKPSRTRPANRNTESHVATPDMKVRSASVPKRLTTLRSSCVNHNSPKVCVGSANATNVIITQELIREAVWTRRGTSSSTLLFRSMLVFKNSSTAKNLRSGDCGRTPLWCFNVIKTHRFCTGQNFQKNRFGGDKSHSDWLITEHALEVVLAVVVRVSRKDFHKRFARKRFGRNASEKLRLSVISVVFELVCLCTWPHELQLA